MNLADLNKIAQAMVTPGKGILAADESSGTIKKRFDAIKVESTEESRRDYREMLFRSQEAMSKYISGVILYDETIWQNAKDGTPLVKLIEQAGAIPGIKVDEGTQALPNCPGELVTVGLDKLAERLKKYYERGARFAKWRAVIDIGAGIPTMTAISVNAHALARYAALCQAAQIVPIVEPEVLMDGDHDIDRCYDVTQRVLNKTFQELRVQRVALEGMILKPNMAISGKKSAKQASVEEVAEKTIRLLKACVPAAVPGIAFLSGGQSDEEATAHLNAMNRIGNLPWKLTFSYGRALQAAPQKAWSGKAENVAAGQRAFTHRARMNALASTRRAGRPTWKRRRPRLASKPAPTRPVPRLYLATPLVEDPSALVTSLPALLAGADIAAVLLRLAVTDQRTMMARIKTLAPAIQNAGAALLLDGQSLDNHVELVARAGADGAHLTGIAALEEALPSLKPDRIAGVGGLATRHDSMLAGELGADYVLFGEPDAGGQRPSMDAVAERLDWWAELFEPPLHRICRLARGSLRFARAGADFVLVDAPCGRMRAGLPPHSPISARRSAQAHSAGATAG